MSQFPILPSNVKEAIDAETLTVSSASSGSCKKKFYVLNCQSARAACELFTKNKQFEYVLAQGVGTTQPIVMKLRDVTASMDNGGKLWIVDLSYSSSDSSKVTYLRNQDPQRSLS